MPSAVRTADPRAAAALTGAFVYVVGGWLLLSRLVGGDPEAIEPPAPATPSAFTCDGAPELKPVIVSIEAGLTYHCFVPAHLVSTDAIVITRDDYDGMRRGLDSG
jgi:hypothetical protein